MNICNPKFGHSPAELIGTGDLAEQLRQWKQKPATTNPKSGNNPKK
ncbi:MAG: hypothetical protein JSU03_07855 [Bacteroidetes bacterium]|nr:hypothetical protein [Bacteroidota bacterium]